MTQPSDGKVAVLQDIIAILESRLNDPESMTELYRLAANELLSEFRKRAGSTNGEPPPEAIDKLNYSAERAAEYNRLARDFLADDNNG